MSSLIQIRLQLAVQKLRGCSYRTLVISDYCLCTCFRQGHDYGTGIKAGASVKGFYLMDRRKAGFIPLFSFRKNAVI